MKLGKILSLLIISSLLSFMAGEIVVRYYLFGIDGFSYSKMASNNTKNWSQLIQLSSDSTLFYELKPNVEREHKFRNFKTNSQGQNDQEYSLNKSDRTIRAAVIGDSFTMGWGIDRQEIYHEIIEQQLNDSADSLKYEFINFGVGGYNFQNYIRVLETKVLRYSPDFILIGFCANNDFKSPKEAERTAERLMNKNRHGFYTSFFMELIRKQIKQQRRMEPSPETVERNDEYVQYAFSYINDFSKKHNIPVTIAYLSVVHEKEDKTRLRVADLSNLNGFRFIDASVLFEDTDVRDYTLNLLDPHPTKEAHQLFARSILESLTFD